MANLYVNDDGTWRTIREVFVNDDGTWRNIREIYVNDGGTWRSVFTSTFMPLISISRSDGGTPAEMYITNTGAIQQRVGATITTYGQWTTDSNTSDYECFVTVTSGSFSTGTSGVWQNLGTTQSWTRGAAASTTQTCGFTIQLRRVSTGEIINTQTGCGLECAR